jgi:hypothetical protein
MFDPSEANEAIELTESHRLDSGVHVLSYTLDLGSPYSHSALAKGNNS